MKPHEIDALRIQIESILREYPEIAGDEILRADMLEGETDINDVLTHLIRVGEDARAYRDGTKDQQARLKARADRYDVQITCSRALMMAILNAADLRKKELPEATIYLRNNPPQIRGVADGDQLPDDLVKIERKPDKVKIKEALQAGRTLEGLALSNSPPSVVVMVK